MVVVLTDHVLLFGRGVSVLRSDNDDALVAGGCADVMGLLVAVSSIIKADRAFFLGVCRDVQRGVQASTGCRTN